MIAMRGLVRFLRWRPMPIALALATLAAYAAYTAVYAREPDTVRPDTRPRTEEGLKRFRDEEPKDARVVLLGATPMLVSLGNLPLTIVASDSALLSRESCYASCYYYILARRTRLVMIPLHSLIS